MGATMPPPMLASNVKLLDVVSPFYIGESCYSKASLHAISLKYSDVSSLRRGRSLQPLSRSTFYD